jgi:hypothetical protein
MVDALVFPKLPSCRGVRAVTHELSDTGEKYQLELAFECEVAPFCRF